jgi:hypothetical protein
MRRIVFSISCFRQMLPVQLVFTSMKSRRNFYTQVERQSFHAARVIRVGLTMPASLPLIPQERQYSGHRGTSHLCHYRTLYRSKLIGSVQKSESAREAAC